jgi:hypothetical protein
MAMVIEVNPEQVPIERPRFTREKLVLIRRGCQDKQRAAYP